MTGDGDSPRRSRTQKFAWIGESPAGLPLAAALADTGAADLSLAVECGPVAGELMRLHPGVRMEPTWSSLLSVPGIQWTVVSGTSEGTLEGARQAAREGIRLLVEVNSAPASQLFTELTLLEAEGPGRLVPTFPLRHLPAIREVGRWLTAHRLGDLRRVTFERTAAPGDGSLHEHTLDQDFVNDADLLRGLLGRFEQITVMRHADTSGRISLATTTLGGTGLPPIIWSTAPGPIDSWRLTLQGELGTALLELDATACRLSHNDTLVSTEPAPDAWRAAYRSLVEGLDGGVVGHGHTNRPAPASWDDLLRVVELLSAGAQSLRRRRTVEVLFEAPSERGLFKSQMTAAGCSLLLWTPVAMVLYLLLAAAVPLPGWAKVLCVVLVFAPVGLFLGLQALLFITRPASGPSR